MSRHLFPHMMEAGAQEIETEFAVSNENSAFLKAALELCDSEHSSTTKGNWPEAKPTNAGQSLLEQSMLRGVALELVSVPARGGEVTYAAVGLFSPRSLGK